MTAAALLVRLLSSPLSPAAGGPLDLEPEDLKPGLVAEYRSLADPKATVTRIEPKPAFTLGRSSPHPRIPPGPFEVTWTGVISVRDPGPITFFAFTGGEVSVAVDGAVLLTGRGPTDATRLVAKEALTREPGYYRLTIRYRSMTDIPARLQLWWEGPSFAREPVPAWRLGHVASELSPAGRQDLRAEQGRAAAGRLGCARCHSSALPDVTDPPPGPSLADVGKRVTRSWVLKWLADPSKVRPEAHMPTVFTADRAGFVERWLVADNLTGGRETRAEEKPAGDHRLGRREFLALGCAACHFVPDVARSQQQPLNRTPLVGLADRFAAGELTAFLLNPHGRYPDGRMPRQPVAPEQAYDITAYLMLWNKPSNVPTAEPPTAKEIQDAARRLGTRDARSAATALLRDTGCTSCHLGLGDSRPRDLPIKNLTAGCLGEQGGVRYAFDAETRTALAAYLEVSDKEKHPSPFADRQRQLAQAGCVQCHQRDNDRPPPIEAAGSRLGGAFLQELPFQRTPRLTNPHQKLTAVYLARTVREGSPGLRGPRFSYKMPAFGPDADALAQALAEADGELLPEADPSAAAPGDPTLGTL